MMFVAGGQLDINIGTFLRRLLRRRVNFVDLLVGPELHPLIAYDLRTGILRLNGRALQPSASFIRHDVFLQQKNSDRSAAPSALNWFYALKGWELSNPNVTAFNRQSASRENTKIYNLLMAQQAGLRIPETVVTNDFTDMGRLLSGPLIQKPVAGGELTTTYDNFLGSLENASSLHRYPRFIQPRLSRPELRIYRVGDAILSFSLSSDDVDYREHQRVTLAPVPTPEIIAEKLTALCNAIELDFAAADFMRDDATGDWCFLEVNSQPMFAAFDDACDGKLCDAMIDHLLRPAIQSD
jgi:glutathione synthase/RimK-type ligase-like ATP-grasp enzyme